MTVEHTSGSPLPAGTRVGKFVIRRVIGQGGMGCVYHATDTLTDEDVALKVLLRLNNDTQRLARFKRESRICKRIAHPNLIRIYDIDEDDGLYFISMELLVGRDLADELAEQPMPSLERIGELSRAVLPALGAAHDAGIFHRDLKPNNIFISDDGRVTVLDFGCAHGSNLPSHTIDNSLVGTPSYMSPEQADTTAKIDHRTDIYSFGIILYEMLTGQVPFTGNSPFGIAAAQMRDTPESVEKINPQVPHDLAKVVERCLRKNPDRRYQSASDLLSVLEDALQGNARASATCAPESNSSTPKPTVVLPKKERISSTADRIPGQTTRHWFRPAGTSFALIGALLLGGWLIVVPDRAIYANGNQYLLAGDLPAAEHNFEQLDGPFIEGAWRLEGIGAVRFEQGRFDEARSAVTEAIEIEPDLTNAHVVAGDLSNAEDDLEAAAISYERASRAKKGLAWHHVRARCRLAQLAFFEGRVEAARAHLGAASAIMLEPGNQVPPLPEFALMRALLAPGESAAALELAIAAGMGGQNRTVLEALAELQERREDPDRSRRVSELVEVLRERVRTDPKTDAPLEETTDRDGTVWMLPLESVGGLPTQPGLGRAMEFWLQEAMITRRDLRVVERELIEQILSEQLLGSSFDLSASSHRTRLGRILAARYMLVGRMNTLGGESVLNMRLIDVETTEILTSLSQPLSDATDGTQMSDFVQRLLEQAGLAS